MKDSFVKLYNMIGEISKEFSITNEGHGVIIANEGQTINGSQKFIDWKEEIIYELETINNSNYINNALLFLNGDTFTGWHDVSDFCKLKGIMETIYKRIDDFYSKEGHLKNSSLNTNNNDIVYNINAEKVNIHSVDNSLNSENLTNNEIFVKLKEIANSISDGVGILNSISEMEKSVKKDEFRDNYSKFIQIAANHMTLFSPFIPLLTSFIK